MNGKLKKVTYIIPESARRAGVGRQRFADVYSMTGGLRGVSEWHPYIATCLLAQASQPLWLVVRDDGSTAVHIC